MGVFTRSTRVAVPEIPERPPPAPEGSDGTTPAEVERERAIARLTDSFARDELTVDEYERRVSLVYGAGTRSELERAGANLPAVRPPEPELAALPLEVTSILSNVVRPGPPVLPKRLRMRSWAGNIELDLSGAQVEPGVTEIEVDVVLGNLEVELPRHVYVDDQTNVLLGSFENPRAGAGASTPPAETPATVVRFRGRVLLGNVSVRLR